MRRETSFDLQEFVSSLNTGKPHPCSSALKQNIIFFMHQFSVGKTREKIISQRKSKQAALAFDSMCVSAF